MLPRPGLRPRLRRGDLLVAEQFGDERPIPGRELGVLQRPLYSYGGPGGEFSAPAPDPEHCPVALARCP